MAVATQAAASIFTILKALAVTTEEKAIVPKFEAANEQAQGIEQVNSAVG